MPGTKPQQLWQYSLFRNFC